MLFLKFFSRGDKKQHLPLFPRSQQQMEAQFHQGSLGNQWVYLTSIERIHEGLLIGVWALQGQNLKIFTHQEWKFLCSCIYGAPLQSSQHSIYSSPTPRPYEELPGGTEQLKKSHALLWVWSGEWRNINHQEAQLILPFASAPELSKMAVLGSRDSLSRQI